MTGNIEIRQLQTIDELTIMQHVEKSVWQMSPIPIHHTFTAMQHGGVILGAFDDSEMIGFLYSFAGFDRGSPYLCSHMLGILPAYRKGGLGTRMKMEQATIARKLGYSMITWTFDPLESQNAYLNLHKLGAVACAYKENYYGTMDDQLNQGLPTDRFQIEWRLHQTDYKENAPAIEDNLVLLNTNELGDPMLDLTKFQGDSDIWFTAIPWNFQNIKKDNIELARSWRQLTGKAFRLLFENGFAAVDVINSPARKTSYYQFIQHVK